MTPNKQPQANAHPTEFNISAIAKLEADALSGRNLTERASDAITKSVGSLAFLALHLTFIGVWMSINLGLVRGIKPFDPFPFGILSVVVSSEAVFLTIFVLISQNRMSRHTQFSDYGAASIKRPRKIHCHEYFK